MNTDDDAALRERLRVFGLSDNEIDTYFALLSLGEATASAVAVTAKSLPATWTRSPCHISTSSTPVRRR
jgi:predicted transcriptional regulator